MLADHRDGLSSSSFLAWSSIAQSVCQQAFSLLVNRYLRSWVRILPSAEEDNLSPFDSNIACLCQSIEINNKYVYIYILYIIRYGDSDISDTCTLCMWHSVMDVTWSCDTSLILHTYNDIQCDHMTFSDWPYIFIALCQNDEVTYIQSFYGSFYVTSVMVGVTSITLDVTSVTGIFFFAMPSPEVLLAILCLPSATLYLYLFRHSHYRKSKMLYLTGN